MTVFSSRFFAVTAVASMTLVGCAGRHERSRPSEQVYVRVPVPDYAWNDHHRYYSRVYYHNGPRHGDYDDYHYDRRRDEDHRRDDERHHSDRERDGYRGGSPRLETNSPRTPHVIPAPTPRPTPVPSTPLPRTPGPTGKPAHIDTKQDEYNQRRGGQARSPTDDGNARTGRTNSPTRAR